MPDENGDQTVSGGVITGTGLISDCYNAGKLKRIGQESFAATGGIAAWIGLGNENPTEPLTFRSCYNVGAMTEGEAGGIVGRVTPGYAFATERYLLENCYYLDTTAEQAAGIGVCAVTAFTSLTGLALLRRKRRDEE